MEEELKCPFCKKLFNNPILLQCYHTLCHSCAANVLANSSKHHHHHHHSASSSEDGTQANVSTGSASPSPTDIDLGEVDKLSLASEADSGVVCSSRPNSYVGTPSLGNLSNISNGSLTLTCPVCKKLTYLDDNGVNSLPKNKVLENIVEKYAEKKNSSVECQLCESKPNPATVKCEQCIVFYCDSCRDRCHPARGPLAGHSLVPPFHDKTESLRRSTSRVSSKDVKCTDHVEESLSMYCTLCRSAACDICIQDGRHNGHEVQPLGQMSKSQKQELSGLLHALSEKARSGTEFIQNLKKLTERVQDTSTEFEARVVAQCDALIEALRERKQVLLDHVKEEKEVKQKVLREQVGQCTSRLHRTTGLLQFSIEALKEADPSAFLQISGGLITRVADVEKSFNKEMELEPRVSAEFEISLDSDSVLQTIRNMTFHQLNDCTWGKYSSPFMPPTPRHQTYRGSRGRKGVVVMRPNSCASLCEVSKRGNSKQSPGSPIIIAEQCIAENNIVTIVWRPHVGSVVEGYVLELDDGNNGDFQEVYCGKETVCTVEGLHFDSMYNARVKAFNHAGDSPYSDRICLQTSEVAWFSLDPHAAHSDLLVSDDKMTATCNSFDDRVILGNVGFSKGVHYWEWTIDKYSGNSDPCFGVARYDIPKDQRVGKDQRGWAMYIDGKRSWYLHSGAHSLRTEGGIARGSTVGVLLDLEHQCINYFINGEAHGPAAFVGLGNNSTDLFYPAMSLNHNVQVTLHSGLPVPPVDSESEFEYPA